MPAARTAAVVCMTLAVGALTAQRENATKPRIVVTTDHWKGDGTGRKWFVAGREYRALV